jgi:hypothetical protein
MLVFLLLRLRKPRTLGAVHALAGVATFSLPRIVSRFRRQAGCYNQLVRLDRRSSWSSRRYQIIEGLTVRCDVREQPG